MINLDMQAAIAKTIAKEYFGTLVPGIENRIDEIKFKSIETNSKFENEKKTIFIGVDHLHDINIYVHELFHAISTNYLSDRVHIGFNNKTFKKFKDNLLFESSYGYAINEGATHAFTRDATAGRFGPIKPVLNYNNAANIYKNLERYVGKSVMKILYTNSNARNFVTTVSKVFHTNEENVLKLILTMDAYHDTFRARTVFAKDYDSADAGSLLANCYVYLSKIISDKMAYEKKKFDFKKDISMEELSKEEVENLNKNMQKYASNNILTNNSNITAKEYEKMAMQIISQEYDNNLSTLNLPKEFKCAEFYNFLCLNNYICDDDRMRKDYVSSELKKTLIQKIYAKAYAAFKEDDTLSANIRTVLSARYAIRAGCTTSDYYMLKSLGKDGFDLYMINSDKDYYEGLCEMKNNENLTK